MPRYFENVTVGDSREFGSHEVTEAQIVEFAERYDPQPFHVDPAAAEESLFGGLVASGWHTAAMTMRLLVENLMDETGVMGAVGVDDSGGPNRSDRATSSRSRRWSSRRSPTSPASGWSATPRRR